MFRWFLPIIGLVALCLPAQAVASDPAEAYVRFPAIDHRHVIFTAEGDLWRVGIDGGDAERLTSLAGEESHAAISPDGTQVAFSASVDGPVEVYVMALDGRAPRRLTYEGGDAIVVGWTPAGEVLYATRRHADLPGIHLARLDPTTRVTTLLPLALASDGAFADDLRTVYFTRYPFQGSFTRRYTGGGAQSIWRYTEGDDEAEPLTADYAGTSRSPMVWNGRVYFVSDRDGTMNIWSMWPEGGDLRQHTFHAVYDVQEPSIASGRIAYQHGADLRLLDIPTGTDTRVPVRVSSHTKHLERQVPSPARWMSSARLSPKGDRMVLTARGQVFVAPARGGRVQEVVRTSGVRYRDAQFLPDGQTLLALADGSGELEFWRMPSDATAPPTSMPTATSVSRVEGLPSPDGRHLAIQTKDLQLWLHDVAAGSTRLVAASTTGAFRDLRWSADGQWLAYVQTADNGVARIWVHGVTSRETQPLTTDRFDSYSPTWSPDGAWLYFLSDRTFESTVASPWGARQPEPYFDRQTRVYALALDREADGLATRLDELPLAPGNYSHLDTDGARLYVLAWEAAPTPRKTLKALSLQGERRLETMTGGVIRYELSLDRSTVLVEKAETLHVFAADGHPPDHERSRVTLTDWTMTVVPRDEWRQIFAEAWRMQRDGFYDPGMHGVDWPAMRTRYEPLVARVSDRAELSDVIAQMMGELSALHMFVRGGDLPAAGATTIASLGATVVRDPARGGYRVTHVLRGDPELPDQRSPLADRRADIRAGDVIEAVDGVGVLAAPDLSLLLRDAVDRDVTLRVRGGATGHVRDVVVRAISLAREAHLRYAEWALDRRARVDAASHQAIGYLHLRAMTAADMGEWQRAFYPVHQRAGLIIDLRRNTGGNIDSWLLSRLLRQAWFYWQPRVGRATPNMPYAYQGHVAVLVDHATASDGEAFAEGIRRLGIGVVIGTRTWGGEIWGAGGSALLDRGTAAVPETGVFGADGQWLIEGHGVVPDIVVDNLPHATFRGHDAQLDAAVAYLSTRIATAPRTTVPRPLYPRPGRQLRPCPGCSTLSDEP